MESNKYLWMNIYPQSNQKIYVYLNDNDEEIYGNIVTNSPIINPYSEKSIYYNTNNICKGKAVKYLRTIDRNDISNVKLNVGLTDINLDEYNKLKKIWNNA